MRALLLFGTEEQKARWLPDLVAGRKLAAFALTEPEAGSDAANVQTTATPSADGSHYVLNGEKRYITNGAIADVLTVMARTPVPGRDGHPGDGLPGHARHARLSHRRAADGEAGHPRHGHGPPGLREHAGAQGEHPRAAGQGAEGGPDRAGLRPHHVRRPAARGMAKTCLRLAAEHARTRVQFGRPLGDFELVQEKLARMAAWTYAMEAMTTVTAGLIDRGLDDYMLETAILKVYSTRPCGRSSTTPSRSTAGRPISPIGRWSGSSATPASTRSAKGRTRC